MLKLNKLIISILGFCIVWFGVLPFILSNAIVVVCNNLSHNSNYEIVISKPTVNTFSITNLKIKSDRIFIKSKNNSAEVKFDDLAIKFRLLPLLSKRFHINSLDIREINLASDINMNLEFDRAFFDKLNNAKVSCDSIVVQKYKIALYQTKINKPIILSGDNFALKLKNRYFLLKMNNSLKIADKISNSKVDLFLPKNNDLKKTVFDIDISELDLANLKIYFKHYLPDDLLSMKGLIAISATKDGFVTELKKCAVIMNDPAKSIILPDLLKINSKFKITRQNVYLESVNFDSKNIHVSFDGKISDYFGKTKPFLNLNVRINPSRVEDFINMLPAFKTEEFDVYKLKKYKFYGDVLANFSVKGRLPEPEILGDVYISDGILTKPIPKTNKGATIKLDFIGKHVNFDVFVPAGGIEKVLVKGSQELYNIKFAELTVKSSQNVDLHVAQSVVNPLHEILNFIIGPVPILDIHGIGNIDISVKGNRKNPHIWGKMNFKDASAKILMFPDFVVKNILAELIFNDQDVKFLTKTAKLNNEDVTLSGVCDLYGKFDFDLGLNKQPVKNLYNSMKTSSFIPELEKLPNITNLTGDSDINLKIFGQVKDLNEIIFNKNVFAKGNINLLNVGLSYEDIDVSKINGYAKFDKSLVETEINAFVDNLPLKLLAKMKNKMLDLSLDMPKCNPNFMIKDKELRLKQYLPYISVLAKYKGSIEKVEYEKISFESQVLSSNPKSTIKFNSGDITLENNKLLLKKIKGFISESKNVFGADLKVDSVFSSTPVANGSINIKTPDMRLMNEILQSDVLPKDIAKIIKNFDFKKGALDLNCKINNNQLSAYSDLAGFEFEYIPYELPVSIINGNYLLKNNTLKLNKINMLLDSMPVLLDGEVKDIFDKTNFNLYLNSKPQQEFIDRYINKNQIYPIKIKGDIVYSAKLKGGPDNFDLKAVLNMSKDSSVYHFGATIGDIENAIKVSIDSKILNGNMLKIKEFSYDKLIDSQNGKLTVLNMLKAWGGVQILKEDLGFEDLYIKTQHPTDARIFNIIFRKPNIKQGQFTSNLKLNGKLSDPKVVGTFHIFETNIPFLDTTMKNIEMVFKDKNIEFNTKGEVLSNDILFKGVLKNKLTPPYKIEKAELYTKKLDLNHIINQLKIAEVENSSTFESFAGFDLTSLVTNNFKLIADNIELRNIHATNFEAVTSISEKGIFNVNDFKFNIAQGLLGGKYSYNLKNNDMSVNLKAKNISANDITWALFDLNNQIYGDLTGDVNLTCNGTDFNHCMETLSGSTVFNVKDGRMPKLGSLEYLLKAGNLVKGGLTGLSINSVIDIISPLKTGEFSNIFGKIRIKDGVARNIEIASNGEDLNLYMMGTYNFATAIADMQVFGLLSRKISNILGPIGNLSINTLFNVIPGVDLSKDSAVLDKINKIPGIELSSKAYRKFIAEIKGNINGDDYVTSFKWIN